VASRNGRLSRSFPKQRVQRRYLRFRVAVSSHDLRSQRDAPLQSLDFGSFAGGIERVVGSFQGVDAGRREFKERFGEFR
jgi:hypothetical protein